MPTTLRVFRVFVASPNDLQPEREALESAIAELNQTTGSTLGLRLDLIRWETSTHPAMGEDPQSIINAQIDDNFDIFIGMLWCRLGQPTPRAESGTIEEFERALARWRANSSAVEVMIYFKDAPIHPSKIDPAQLQGVHTFKERIRQEGLTSEFSSTDAFLTAIRIHLTRVLLGWGDRSSNIPQTLLKEEGGTIQDDREESGFLDLIESSIENFGLSTSASERITVYIQDLGNATAETTAKLTGTDYSTPSGVAYAKRTINSLAERMNDFATKLRSDTSILRDTFGRAIHAIQVSASLLADFRGDPSQQLGQSAQMLASLETTIHDTREKIESFRHTIESTPRMTTQFNRAKRVTGETLEQLESTLDEELRLVGEARKLQEELLERYRQDA
ncbi:MAG TPA: DUF4062 domain-containing protein [Thermoanaerobaculia bacterium]|jgi:hypothetical protein|nr:DUF4062 domain-containing protein [Thermoanaerobaculia bacterium]